MGDWCWTTWDLDLYQGSGLVEQQDVRKPGLQLQRDDVDPLPGGLAWSHLDCDATREAGA